MSRRAPDHQMVSDEATFELHIGATENILIMRPHGVEPDTDDEVGWRLTHEELHGLARMLNEATTTPLP